MPADDASWTVEDLFSASEETPASAVVSALGGSREVRAFGSHGQALIDRFGDIAGVACAFLRTNAGPARNVSLALPGGGRIRSCASGGWIIDPALVDHPSYWIPDAAVVRTIDARGRILSESVGAPSSLEASPASTRIGIPIPADAHLDCVVWRIPADASDLIAGLERPLVLERQPMFMLGSHTTYSRPADLYRYLVHGHVYENRFEWRHKWKICAENEAYSLYLTLHGLELATGKRIYSLLKRQIVLSVLSRQSEDGGWYHGEWSDFMESHYRLHNGAVLLLEAAVEQYADDSVRSALRGAAAFTARHTDDTDLGLWFLHDSLEEDVELLRRSGSRLIPARTLGKSPGTKLILNTHLDAMVVLDRYRQITGDEQYADQISSARHAMRRLLALRPAEALYRLISWAVGLTLLPPTRAERLPLPLRAARRAARELLLPRLHVIKRRFPRMVMPSGLVERHLSMPHYDVNYQTVNLMDLLRVWRRFPEEELDAVVNAAITAVRDTGLLQSWIESKQRQALGYWVEALFHLCTLRQALEYRVLLADAILIAEDAGFGLPPSVLGANPEAVAIEAQVACPSPTEPHLRVANLGRAGRTEILVVNCSASPMVLQWERSAPDSVVWTAADGRDFPLPAQLPSRAWAWGREQRH